MNDINLIPQTAKVSQEVTKKTNALGSVLKLFIALLFISLVTAASIWGIIYYRLGQVREEHGKLKAEVENLKRSEQRLILIRDRLGKISKVKSEHNTFEELETAKDLSLNIISPSKVNSLEIDPGKVVAEIETDSSLNITRIFSQLVGSGKYSRVSMLNFGYSPENGYVISMQIAK